MTCFSIICDPFLLNLLVNIIHLVDSLMLDMYIIKVNGIAR